LFLIATTGFDGCHFDVAGRVAFLRNVEHPIAIPPNDLDLGIAPDFAEAFINTVAQRLRETAYLVWTTPFGYFCEWDLGVYGDSLAKVWKEIH